MISNKDIFIEKSKNIYGDKYDYSKVNYINNKTKIIITCKIHGEFEQTPFNHIIRKYECSECSGKNKNTTEKIIEKAKIIHGNLYDYSKVKYVNNKTKITIICKEHGEFEKTPNSHINQKNGCSMCSGKYRPSTEEFIIKANLVHKNLYDYSKVNYINTETKIIIICQIHGEFKQTPHSHVSGNQGCPKCGKTNKLTTKEFIEKANLVHENLYDYSKVIYVNAKTKITIICKKHGEFEQTPQSHVNSKTGCSKCSGNYNPRTEEFIRKANLVHENSYDYSKVKYINRNTKITIICKKHGEFQQIPHNHILKKSGCTKCCINKYSKEQISWLNYLSKKNNIYIQHAENEGEFIIPNTKYKADGYCKEINTIFEYYGSYYHGNPLFYDKNDYNKTSKKKFGELYEQTLIRENNIKKLGYNLITIWDNQWKKLLG
jgi:hypothetical protein